MKSFTHLGKGPQHQQWQSVHTLSRSQKEKHLSNVKPDTVDLTQDAKGIARQLEGVHERGLEGEYWSGGGWSRRLMWERIENVLDLKDHVVQAKRQ